MHQIFFSIHNISIEVWVSLAVSIIAALWLIIFYRARINRIHITRHSDFDTTRLPGVSVIVLAQDSSHQLASMLPKVMNQVYPGEYEVVVVNDGSNRDVTDVVNYLSNTHKNLRITFIPSEAHNLSRTKLGISLGIKAARHEYVVITTSLSNIPSEAWLRLMCEPFARGKDVSLGIATLSGLKGAMNRFDELTAQTIWLSAAMAGKPYRGTGYNIGYRRQLFFDAKGFSRSLTLHHGEDDIFISQIATPENTGVVVDNAATLSIDRYMPAKALRDLRMQHCFTGRFVSKAASRLFGFSTIMLWIWLAATVVGITLSLPNTMPTCFFIAIGIAIWLPLTIVWSKAARAQQLPLSKWKFPFLLMTRWIRTAIYKLKCGKATRKNYTWIQR